MLRGSKSRQGSGMYLDTTTGWGAPAGGAPRRHVPRKRSDAPQPPNRPPPSAQRTNGHMRFQAAEEPGCLAWPWQLDWLPLKAAETATVERIASRSNERRVCLTALGGVEQIDAAIQRRGVSCLHRRDGDAVLVVAAIAPGLLVGNSNAWAACVARHCWWRRGASTTRSFAMRHPPTSQTGPKHHHAISPAPKPYS